jgi:excisionase family DNA binding protein
MGEAPVVPASVRVLVNLDEAATYLAVSRRHVERLVAAGTLAPVHLGRAVRLVVRDLDNYIQLLRSEGQ